jgi:rhodanese-related sulfurtransferase
MPNPYGVPEINVREVARKREAGEAFVLMDVRERNELGLANLGDGVEWVPLSDLAARRLEALPPSVEDKETEIVVFCHTGVRSSQVAAWLRQQGWTRVWNMDGGIAAYAHQVDPGVGTY